MPTTPPYYPLTPAERARLAGQPLTHAEVSRLGGLSRSPKKLAAAKKNAATATKARLAKLKKRKKTLTK